MHVLWTNLLLWLNVVRKLQQRANLLSPWCVLKSGGIDAVHKVHKPQASRSTMALFTKKDLGLLLPDDTPGDAVSLRHTKTTYVSRLSQYARLPPLLFGTLCRTHPLLSVGWHSEETKEFEPLKPKVDPSTKVTRYRAGQVPHFAHGFEDERGFVTASSHVRAVQKKGKAQFKPASVGRKRVEAQVVVASAPSDRGRRERAPSSDEAASSGDDAARALQDSSSEDEEDEIDRRRSMLRNKMKARGEAQAAPAVARAPVEPQIVRKSGEAVATKSVVEDSASSSSSGSEWETDTDESEPGEELMKPVFVPKKARGTVQRQEELAAEEERRQQRELEKLNARKLESRRSVAEEIRREQEGADQTGGDTDVEMPDDTDGVDPAQEYRDWELREMRRIKRYDVKPWADRDVNGLVLLTIYVKLRKNEPKEKKKLKFMQKYYHKGAFYVDDDSVRSKDDVRKRDASDATLEDKFNKEMLPEVMQVKNFGRAGRYACSFVMLALPCYLPVACTHTNASL
ncbi:hypothetical protein BBJ28_00017372 [Nothophytophthora sp. Chile5]|nr:hypothetical protein BBJ28_00017372 [Nothophytophthora sp. Chile5]